MCELTRRREAFCRRVWRSVHVSGLVTAGIRFRARRTGNGRNADGRRGVWGSDCAGLHGEEAVTTNPHPAQPPQNPVPYQRGSDGHPSIHFLPGSRNAARSRKFRTRWKVVKSLSCWLRPAREVRAATSKSSPPISPLPPSGVVTGRRRRWPGSVRNRTRSAATACLR